MTDTAGRGRCCLCGTRFELPDDALVWVDGRFGDPVIHKVCQACKGRPDVEQQLIDHANQEKEPLGT